MARLRAADAADLHRVLDDPALHAFTGGQPATREELEERFRGLESRRSSDGTEDWLNWVVRCDGRAIGTVQATLRGDEAEFGWVIGTEFQGRGYAREAALDEGLDECGGLRPRRTASGAGCSGRCFPAAGGTESNGEAAATSRS